MHLPSILADVRRDFSYAFRVLRRNLLLTVVIVGALATGIGANAAIFTLIDSVLVQRLPVAHPDQLVGVGDPTRVTGRSTGGVGMDLLSYPLYRALAEHHELFTGVLASGSAGRLDVRIDSLRQDLEHPRGRWVSGNYFDVLGVPALRGRTFDTTTAAAQPGGSPTVVISHGYWTRRFQNDASIIGRAILIDGVRMTVIGVTPPSFTGDVVGITYDLWLPATMHDMLEPNLRSLDRRSVSWLLSIGRLRSGVTLSQARDRVPTILAADAIANSVPGALYVAGSPGTRPFIESAERGFSRVRDTFHAPLLTLMVGVALLLCIICANVANLLLARAVARGREMTVRLALGADRARLVRQLLTESALLAAMSAALGLFVAWVGSSALMYLVSPNGSVAVSTAMSGRLLGFTILISVLAVGLFGLVPALRASRVDLASSMRGSASLSGWAGTARPGGVPIAKVFIAGQVALSVLLLTGAAMLARSLRNIENAPVGFDRDHLVVIDVDLRTGGYIGARQGPLVHALRDRVAAVPGVAAVTYSVNGIFTGTDGRMPIEVPGFTMRSAADSLISFDFAGPSYAHAIGAKLAQGRDLDASDENKPGRTALVNSAFADFYWPGQSPIGKTFHRSDSIVVQVVGVVADARDHSLTAATGRRVYFPYIHSDTSATQLGYSQNLRLEVRTVGDPANLVQPLRRAVLSVDQSLPIDNIDPVSSLMASSIAQQRLLAQLAGGFGVLALVLAAVGLYGVTSYAINRRIGEIGLRVALGAQRADVIRMILLEAIKLVGSGVVVGLPLALLATRLLRTQLHGVAPTDPVSLGVALVVLTGSAVIAALVPAVRASRLSPMRALRAG